jgi:hypothetical protein
MKFLTALLLLVFFSATASFSQKPKVPIPSIQNTGVDRFGNVLADGEADPHYDLIISADKNFPGPSARVVLSHGFPLNCWLQNSYRSKWIAPRTDAGEWNASGIYVYRLQFDLTGFKPHTAEIKGGWTTDNAGMDIQINGNSTGYDTPTEAFKYGFFYFEIKEGFKSGLNYIDFIVYNDFAPTGLRVEIQGIAEPLDFASGME